MATATRASVLPKADSEELYCRICHIKFKSWEELKRHRLDSPKHNACIFCTADFRTQDGRKRHQDQQHAAAQDLSCYGCGEKFQRAGSYVNHIEMRLCPVIHPIEFERRRNERALVAQRTRDAAGADEFPWAKPAAGKAQKSASTNQPVLRPYVGTSETTAGSGSTEVPYIDARFSIHDDDLLVFEDNPQRPAWGTEEEDLAPACAPLLESENDFPPLSGGIKLNKGKGKAQDLPLGNGDKLDEKNKAWLDHSDILPNAPKPVSPVKPRQIMLLPGMAENEWHELDPSNPSFRAQKYFNPINSKYKCPWAGCKSLLPSGSALVNHLRSAAHMDIKLRCPSCLRMYFSYTALIQHAESQAKKCDIRNSTEYRHALDEVGNLVTITGAHAQDATKKYKSNTAAEIAEANKLAIAQGTTPAQLRAKKTEESWEKMVW